ncbi:PEP/pyruvate-binding domain-containing protein [Paenarthrobacter sp. NPDC056912]|uniref:PEP/pyruvate-binding domain-containing protein n=1 Tax=Paenarthrobacter sp. NPDC056912 TaxID=3345965 RepID=UPI00366D263F
MILTGPQIATAVAEGDIVIAPFSPANVNPNSYNFTLGSTLRVYDSDVLDPRVASRFHEFTIGEEGFVLEPGRLYLAHTRERLGGHVYAPTFAARSSVARLGVFINLSASLGDIGFVGQWTLQLYTAQRVRVYPGMSIGQMMWWCTEGEIDLYDGKYQDAKGPRSSDIHLDVHKHESRNSLPRLGADVDPEDVGGKFATLSVLSRQFPVPPAFSVPLSFLERSIEQSLRDEIETAMEDIRATVGSYFLDGVARLERAASQFHLTSDSRDLILTALRELRQSGKPVRFAVRSSSLREDGTAVSGAGVFASILDLSSDDEVLAAVETVWRSWYSAPAVAARVREHDFEARSELALFIQVMVKPRRAGVAFTADEGDLVRISAVNGLGDALMAGIVAGTSAEICGGDLGGDHSNVVDLARQVRDVHAHEVDLEWAEDDEGTWLLQARPVTRALDADKSSDMPVFDAARLYGEDVPGFSLGDVAPIYASYVTKRGPAHALAKSHGLRTGNGAVLRYNQAGLDRAIEAGSILDMILGTGAPEFVADLGATIRQIIEPEERLAHVLTQALHGRPEGAFAQAVIREFVRGDAGFISHRVPGKVVVEISTDGLLALNRGTAAASTLVLYDDGTVESDAGVPKSSAVAIQRNAAAIRDFSDAMAEKYGSTALEWVELSGGLFFTDYSQQRSGQTELSVALNVIAPGTARGPLVDLRSYDEVLTRLSVGPAVSINHSSDLSGHAGLEEIARVIRASTRQPIVRATSPFAVLSVFLSDVAGFVFDGGSSLSHLGILLREHGVPAVVGATTAGVGEHLIADGTVTAL